jgi:6-phosphogluconolactonase
MGARLEVVADARALAAAAAAHFFRLAYGAIAHRGAFHIALAGGETPRAAYAQVADGWRDAAGGPVDWSNVHVYWGDERMVPPDDPRSNFGMARGALLYHLPIPAENVHPIPADAADPAGAAAGYDATLRRYLPAGGTGSGPVAGGLPCFDLVLLGLGSDGHTASLFPGSPALEERTRLAAATVQPESGEPRVTLTLPLLNHAAEILVLVSGAGKSSMLERVARGAGRPAGGPLLPAERLQPTTGNLLWLADEAAAPWARR